MDGGNKIDVTVADVGEDFERNLRGCENQSPTIML